MIRSELAGLDESLVFVQTPITSLARRNRHPREVSAPSAGEREFHFRDRSTGEVLFGLRADLNSPAGKDWSHILIPTAAGADRSSFYRVLNLAFALLDIPVSKLRSASDEEGEDLVDLSRLGRPRRLALNKPGKSLARSPQRTRRLISRKAFA